MEIKSYNSNSKSFVRQLFVPSIVQVILYALTSLFLLTVGSISTIWNYLNNDVAGNPHSSSLFSTGLLGSSTQARVVQVMIWGLIGVLIYTVIWFIKSIITNLRNDIVADEYVHPHSYDRKSYWKSIALRKGFFAVIILVLIGYIYLFFKIFPIFSDIYASVITDFSTHNLIKASFVVLGMTILLHIFIALAQLAINSWQFIHADL